MSKISVIIPVYNKGEQIRRAVNNLLNQTMKDLEIILVDDGSTDESGYICDEYASKNSNVVIIHKLNSGPSSARNVGLDVATSEYIAFLDADDYFSEDTFENIQRIIIEFKPDCICFGLQYIINNTVQGKQIPNLPKNQKFKE